MSHVCGEISFLVWMIPCPLLDSKSLPALGCCAGQLQVPTIPSTNALVFRNPHFPQLIFKKNHMHAHPCFYLSLRKKIKRGEKRLLQDISIHLFSESNLFCIVKSENMVRVTLHARDTSYNVYLYPHISNLLHVFMITNLYPLHL